MKTRTGFVSNSSTTSFLVLYDNTKIKETEVFDIICKVMSGQITRFHEKSYLSEEAKQTLISSFKNEYLVRCEGYKDCGCHQMYLYEFLKNYVKDIDHIGILYTNVSDESPDEYEQELATSFGDNDCISYKQDGNVLLKIYIYEHH